MITGTSLQKQFTTDSGQVVQALDNVSFEAARGEFFVLLGPSGSGKTTTLRSVAGIETADTGKIQIGSQMVFCSDQGINLPPEERPVAMVFQSYALWPHMDVYNNIVFPLRKGVRRVAPNVIKQRVEAVVETLPTDALSAPSDQPVVGRSAAACCAGRAMALEPDILLMDEPLSNLDAKLRASLRVEIKNLTSNLGITTLYVTHDQVEAMVMGDKIAVMKNGAIVEQGTPMQLYKHPKNEFVARFLGEMNFVPATLLQNGSGAAAKTPWGTVPLACVSDRIAGNHIKLGFRPEDVMIGDQDNGCGISAQVSQAHYIGDALMCELVSEGCAFSARLPNSTSLSAGDPVQISLKNSDFTAFPGDVI